MKTRLFLPDREIYHVIADVENKEHFYAIPVAENDKQRTISRNYGSAEKVPDKYTVTVYRVGLVDNSDPKYSKYDIIDTDPIDFPINRIHWLFIKLI